MNTLSRKKQGGFLLLEALLAMLILSLSVPAMALLFQQAGRSSTAAGCRTIALQLAQAEQEKLKAPAVLQLLKENDERVLMRGGAEYRVIREKRSFSLSNLHLCQVDITVRWSDPLNRKEMCQLKIAALRRQD